MEQIDKEVPPGGVQANNNIDNKSTGSGPVTLSEKALLVEKKRRVSLKTASLLRRYTLIISWISVVYLTIMGVVTIVLAVIYQNSSSFAFALDALLDAMSSAVVIWRFYGTAASTLYSSKREKIACMILGVLFILCFISILTRSMVSLILHILPKESTVLWALSILNSGICIIFLVCKAILARKLESMSIATDAVNSGIGFVISFTAVITEFMYNERDSVWYIDPIVGIICSVFFLAYGIWIIVYEVRYAKSEEPSMELTDQVAAQ